MDGTGSYVYVDASDDEISIYQDYLGSYGLYLFQEEDYFAISNSFLKLVEYLSKSDKSFSVNQDYANYYLSVGISSVMPDETLVSEITMLKHNLIVRINRNDKSIAYERIDYREGTVSIDSQEGMDILDNWYYKWVGLIRTIFESKRLTVDLSGGFDSRVIAALWLTANVNLDHAIINSSHHQERFKEDFEIASEIADHFGLELNKRYRRKKVPFTLQESLDIPLYVKFGFHKKRYFPIYKNAYTQFRVSGHCGGTIRNYPNIPVWEYVDSIVERAKSYDNHVEESTRKIFMQKTEEMSEIYGLNKDSKRLSSILYRESRNRHHFGKSFVETYLKNVITLAPFTDALISRLKIYTAECRDDLLIFTLILLRYCPDLLDFKVEGGRSFNQQTIEYAHMLNERYPFKPRDLDFVDRPVHKKKIARAKHIVEFGEHPSMFMDIFTSHNFIKDFEKYFTKNSYKFIQKTLYKDDHYIEGVHGAIDVLKIHEYVDLNRNLNYDSIGEWFKAYPIVQTDEFEMDKLLDKYRTLRVDIINKGLEDNDFEILYNSDGDLMHSVPDWFNNSEGIGHVLKTQRSSLKLKIKIINDGEITVRLRAENAKDVNGNHFPVYVDCSSFKVNGEPVIDEHTLITFQGFKYIDEVKNGDVLTLDIDWMPFNESSVYDLQDVDALVNENEILKRKLEALEEENEIMKKNLENKGFDFGNIFRKGKK